VSVLRADIILDAGHSLWPEGDLGQVEGGYVQGLGLFTSEAVRVDTSTGALLSKDLWNYKVPTVDTVPRIFNVALLEGGSHARGVYSSKAVGEPPLLLAVTALTATQQAINAVRAGLGTDAAAPATNGEVIVRGGGDGGDGSPRPAPASLLTAPATPRAVRAAVGRLPLAEWARGE
jgi:xanthine dehydrogenase molybdopterin-binding subunit B